MSAHAATIPVHAPERHRRGPRNSGRFGPASDRFAAAKDFTGEIRLALGLALRRAVPSTKVLRTAAGCGEDAAGDWMKGAETCPAVACGLLLACLGLDSRTNPLPLVEQLRAIALRFQVVRTDDDALVARYHELQDLEAEAEGAENRRSQTVARTRDLLAQAAADEREAELQVERASVARELTRRAIDPWAWPRAA